MIPSKMFRGLAVRHRPLNRFYLSRENVMGWEAKCLLAWRHPVPDNERIVGFSGQSLPIFRVFLACALR